jgi:hypothetical protein
MDEDTNGDFSSAVYNLLVWGRSKTGVGSFPWASSLLV